MNRSVITLTFGSLICLLCVYIIVSRSSESKVDLEATAIPVRESITFILGEDKEADNRYYEEAMHYYRYHPDARTTYLITDCRSLLEVRDYLVSCAPANGLPWGLINMVSHGNQWTGLSARVTPDSKRATSERIMEHVRDSTLLPLPRNVADSNTEIFLHGCGLGNNQELIDAVSLAFGDTGETPVVRASKLFEYYASIRTNDTVACTQRYMANAWTLYYKMGEVPTMNTLMNEFRDKYVDASVDWQGALSREQPRWVGDVYHYTFEVPVKWVIPIAEGQSLPDFATIDHQYLWLSNNARIMDELDRLNIPYTKFNWSFNKVYVDNQDGTKSEALWVKGYCTIVCVLQALTDGQDDRSALHRPFTPNLNDTRYYYATPRCVASNTAEKSKG